MVCCRSGRHAAFTLLLVTTYSDKQRTLLAALTSDLWLTSNLTHSTCPAAAADSSAVIPFYTPITPTRYSVGLLASLSSRWLSTCHWDHVRQLRSADTTERQNILLPLYCESATVCRLIQRNL